MTGFINDLVVLVCVDEVAFVGKIFNACHVATLANGSNNDVSFDDALCAFCRYWCHAVHSTVTNFQAGCSAIIA